MNNTSPTIGSNNASSSTTKEVPSKQEGIAICSVFVLEAVLIVLGNLLTIVLFALNKELRKKSLDLVINMAFADFILGAVSIPSLIYAIGGEYYLWTATENWFFYTFFNVLDAVFFQVSLSSAALISVERFYAIYWPLKHRTLSKRTYRIAIFKACMGIKHRRFHDLLRLKCLNFRQTCHLRYVIVLFDTIIHRMWMLP